ncbi:MAG: DUF1592 domain-containing protein [Planctomycetota bacterium]
MPNVEAVSVEASGLREHVAGFFQRHCNDCHGEGADEGGFEVSSLVNDLSDEAGFDRWVHVIDRVGQGEMPPPEAETVDASDLESFIGVVHPALHGAHAKRKKTTLRRLNRLEFETTLNDLFGTVLDLERMLPEDGRSHEFNNIGDALGISSVHLQQYMAAIDRVLDAAIATTPERPPTQTVSSSYATVRDADRFLGKQWKKLDDGAVAFFGRYGYPSGMLRGTEVKPPGRYRVRVTGYAYQSDDPITIRIGGTSFKPGSEKPTYAFASLRPGKAQTVEIEAEIRERYMISIDPWGIHPGSYNLTKQGSDGYTGPGIAIQKVELVGPLMDQYPSPGHQLLFEGFERTPVPKKSKWQNEQLFEVTAGDLDSAVRRTLLRVSTRAFRRPVQPSEVDRYVTLFHTETDLGSSVEDALRASVTALLCSPDFLFFRETEGWLDDHAIATRLAYFLTRSLPDAELRATANAGKLASDPKTLLAEARRLMADPHHSRFVEDFCDAWLNLRDIEFTSPDQQLFPEYDAYLQYSMLQETRAFVAKLIQENLPVVNIVRSDFAMLNDRLAEHYRLPPVMGPDIRKVKLPNGSVRGGLLSQASVMKVSANGTNTSPVVRGVWVTDRILGLQTRPPPPGIPGVEPDIRGASTLRELLNKHRDLDSCRGCHQTIDPPGFALEVFNPIGGYRSRFRSLGQGDRVDQQIRGRRVRYKLGPDVDASGVLSDGTEFANYRDFRDALAAKPRMLATALTKKVLTFATGRDMGYSDRPLIASIVDACESDGYRVRDLLERVILSEAFRRK